MKNLIVDLPRNLSVLILSEYLFGKEVGKLDSAFCRVKLREPFLELLRCSEFMINQNDVLLRFSSHSKCIKEKVFKSLRWYVTRSIKIRRIFLSRELEDVNATLIVEFLNVSCKQAEELTVHHQKALKLIHYPHLRFNNIQTLNWLFMPECGEELAEVLRRSPNLRKLIIHSNSALDGSSFQGVMLTTLSSVHLIGTFGESDVTFLAPICPNVTTLELTLFRFGDFKDPDAMIVTFKQLKNLMLDDENETTDADLIRIADGCPELRHIDIRNAVALTDNSVVQLCSRCTMLENIRLVNCYRLSSTTLQAIGDNLYATLRELALINCAAINSCAELQSCRLLENLSLSIYAEDCVLDFTQLFISCPILHSIDIGGRVIDDAVLRALAHHCPQLKDLTMVGCTGYTPAGLLELVHHAKQLKALSMSSGVLNVELSDRFEANGCAVHVVKYW